MSITCIKGHSSNLDCPSSLIHTLYAQTNSLATRESELRVFRKAAHTHINTLKCRTSFHEKNERMASSARISITKLLNSSKYLRFALPFRSGSPSFSTAAAVATDIQPEAPPPSSEVLNGARVLDLVKDYEDYRRNLYGGLTHKALLVDAVGTLVVPSQPMAQVFFFYSLFSFQFC